MNISTANFRLCKDLLFAFIQKDNICCYRCNKPLTRDTFTIEHKEFWKTAENPKEMFFNLNNIAYSHHKCNAAHTTRTKHYTWLNGDRNTRYPTKVIADKKRIYDPTKRKAQYLRTGK